MEKPSNVNRRTALKGLGAAAVSTSGLAAVTGTAAAAADAETVIHSWRHDEATSSLETSCHDKFKEVWDIDVNPNGNYPRSISLEPILSYSDLDPYLDSDTGVLAGFKAYIDDNADYDTQAQGVVSMFLCDVSGTQLGDHKKSDAAGVSSGTWDSGGKAVGVVFENDAGYPEATYNHEIAHTCLAGALNDHALGDYVEDSNGNVVETTTMGTKKCCGDEVFTINDHAHYGYHTSDQIQEFLATQSYDGTYLSSCCF